MGKTVAERLLAGEHRGCPSWGAVARKLGITPRSIRHAREHLAARGHAVELCLTPTCTPAEPDEQFDFSDEEPTKPNIQKADKWPSVEAFDAEPAAPVVPPFHGIKGVSSYVVDGEVRGQWIKTSAQNDERAAWMQAVREAGETLPRLEPTPVPESIAEDLLVVLPVGDPHIGMLGWHEDAGENFDMDIAERQLIAAFQHLIARAPAAARALLVFIGDNAHADGQANTTTKGTRVDVDGRTIKMARTIVRIFRRTIDLSLEKFGHSTVIVERGNHDELIAAMVALMLSLAYENEPRVTIDLSPEMYHWFRFGEVLIGTHHGDKAKPEQLLGVMAVDRAADWSTTTHRRFYCGHYHHQIVKEVPGLIVEYLPTLASSDAWHRSMGYRSQRAMYMDVFHRKRGHVDRHIVGIQQVRAA